MGEGVVEIYRQLVGDYPDLKVKGKKTAYTAMNGNMFSFVDASGVLCIRLGNGDKAAYEAAHGTGDVIQYGAVMRGYVPVVAELLADMDGLRALFAMGVANARTLKAKPTTRKK